MSGKELGQLSIATFEHGQNLWERPGIHKNGSHTGHVHTERTMMTTAVQTQECTITHGGPFGMQITTIHTAMIAINVL